MSDVSKPRRVDVRRDVAALVVYAGLLVAAVTRGTALVAAPVPDPGDDLSTVALRANLSRLVDHPARASERWSILAVSLDRGDTLFARDPHQVLAPASNMKLFTTAAALEYLGSEHRFTTYLIADGPIRNGVLEGNLFLYGTGDPTLGNRFAERPAPALEALADSLVALGVRQIRGAVVGDGSFFSGPSTGEGWQRAYMNAWYSTPAGALSVHENMVRVRVTPGPAGHPPALDFTPGGAGIAVINEAISGGGGRARVVRSSFEGPIHVTGRVGGASTHDVIVGDPAMYAAALFRDILLDREITLRGGARSIEAGGASPVTGRTVFAPALEPERQIRVLAEHVSGPLTEILDAINQQSHNFFSEQVLRATGRAATGVGSPAAGAHAVKQVLHKAGVDVSRLHVADGCGLSPYNDASAAAFIALLAYMANSPHADAFIASLPVAGEAPRFRRMGGTPAEGNLRAKTGTITRVSALSGYVTSASGERIAFSIIGNDLGSIAQGKHIENAIGAQLAAFDRSAPFTAADDEAMSPPAQ